MRRFLFVWAGIILFACSAQASWSQAKKSVFPAGSFCDDLNSGLCAELAHCKTL